MNHFTKQKLEKLVDEYKEECCTFNEVTCVSVLERYLCSMEESHLKAVLYSYMKHKGDV